jgi:SAM-dependent methyltransferase
LRQLVVGQQDYPLSVTRQSIRIDYANEYEIPIVERGAREMDLIRSPREDLAFADVFKTGESRRSRMALRCVLTRQVGCILTAVMLFGCTIQVHGAPPKPAELGGLEEACRPLNGFIAGCTISVGNSDQDRAEVSLPSSCPLPHDARVIAYEENREFICVTGEFSTAATTPQRDGDARRHKVLRRFICLKPSTYVIDDLVELRSYNDLVKLGSYNDSVQWRVRAKNQLTLSNRFIRLNDGQQDLACHAIWPPKGTFERAGEATDLRCQLTLGGGYLDEPPFPGMADAKTYHRFLQIWYVGTPGEKAHSLDSSNYLDGMLDLSITTTDRSYDLTELEPWHAGWIMIRKADGETLTELRPLPGGVLPHGPRGRALIERWDRAYQEGRHAPWDTGSPAGDLTHAVESGEIKPCRTIVLGCGSGTNAIYLAKKGFEVTAIDVAPTALSIARAKAEKAGVRVRWVLADVLKLPDLGLFDLVFDRGCYHNVRYVDAPGFVASLRKLTKPGSQCLILSCNRDGPPGVREHHMREDFSELFGFLWVRESDIQTGRAGANRRPSWSVLLKRKGG